MGNDKQTTGKAPAAHHEVKGASEIMDSKMSGGRYGKKTRKNKHPHKKHGGKSRSHKKPHKKHHHKKSHKKHAGQKKHDKRHGKHAGQKKSCGHRGKHAGQKKHKKKGGSVVATAALPFGLLALQKFFQTRKGRKDLKKASKSVRKTARKVSRTLRKAL